MELRRGSVTANDLRFGYLEAGPRGGPLALCLHGFPHSAHTWRHLLPELARAGYRAVAPFTRGYAPSAIPTDGAYQSGALAADAIALHEAFGGGDDAVLIGHDWGAITAYPALAHAPGRWRRAVTMAVPPIGAMMTSFFDYEQLRRSFYIFLFQTPLGEVALNREFVTGLWRDWSPGYGAARDVEHVMACLGSAENRSAALGYYRAMFDASRHLDRYSAEQEAAGRQGSCPVLSLHGADDGCLGASTADPETVLAALPSGSGTRIVQRAGHFLHLERPREVNRLVLEWLAD